MIVSELYDGQGLGNQLWNYVLARIIADRNKCDFSILGRERFKGSEFLDIDFGAELRGGSSPEGGPPDILPDGILHYYRERQERFMNTTADISRTDPGLLTLPPQTKFDGICQSTKYLTGYRDSILEWISVKDAYKPASDDQTCIIHMRCGDFSGLKDIFLPASYYRQAIEYLKTVNPAMKFFCVSDQPEIARQVLPEAEMIGASIMSTQDPKKAAHHHGGPIGIDFSLLMNAKYLIIPNSSFAWWAAYLNRQNPVVIAPKYWARYNTSDGFWSTSDIITDQFTYLDKNGRLFSPGECWEEKNTFEATHQQMFRTVTKNEPPPSQPGGLFSLIKRVSKKVLS